MNPRVLQQALNPATYIDTSSLSRRVKDTIWLHGTCQVVGEVRVRVADDGNLWLPGGKAVGISGALLSGDAKAEDLEVTEVKETLVAPEMEKKESPATDEYRELRRLDENEREGSPIYDMDDRKREESSGLWNTRKPEREANVGWSADQERALKEISKIIQEQAQSDMMKKTSFEDRPSSPQALSPEAERAVGGISPQEDLIHFQEKQQEPVPSWCPVEREEAGSGRISQPLEKNFRRFCWLVS